MRHLCCSLNGSPPPLNGSTPAAPRCSPPLSAQRLHRCEGCRKNTFLSSSYYGPMVSGTNCLDCLSTSLTRQTIVMQIGNTKAFHSSLNDHKKIYFLFILLVLKIRVVAITNFYLLTTWAILFLFSSPDLSDEGLCWNNVERFQREWRFQRYLHTHMHEHTYWVFLLCFPQCIPYLNDWAWRKGKARTADSSACRT